MRKSPKKQNANPFLAELKGTEVAAVLAVMWGLWVLGGFWAIRIATSIDTTHAWIISAITGALLLTVTVKVGVWWYHYEGSGEQHRHQVLSRVGAIAQTKQVRDHLSKKSFIDNVKRVRPIYVQRNKISSAYGVAPFIFPELLNEQRREPNLAGEIEYLEEKMKTASHTKPSMFTWAWFRGKGSEYEQLQKMRVGIDVDLCERIITRYQRTPEAI